MLFFKEIMWVFFHSIELLPCKRYFTLQISFKKSLCSECSKMVDFEEGDSFSDCCSVPVNVCCRRWHSPCNFSGEFIYNTVNVIITRKNLFPISNPHIYSTKKKNVTFLSSHFLHLFLTAAVTTVLMLQSEMFHAFVVLCLSLIPHLFFNQFSTVKLSANT